MLNIIRENKIYRKILCLGVVYVVVFYLSKLKNIN